jgi:hypothetical protein
MRVLADLSNPAALRICVALIQSSDLLLMTQSPCNWNSNTGTYLIAKKSKTRGRRKEADSERYKNNRLLTPLYVAEYIMPSFVPAIVPRLVPKQSILMILMKSSASVKQSVFRVVLASCNQSIFYIRLRPWWIGFSWREIISWKEEDAPSRVKWSDSTALVLHSQSNARVSRWVNCLRYPGLQCQVTLCHMTFESSWNCVRYRSRQQLTTNIFSAGKSYARWLLLSQRRTPLALQMAAVRNSSIVDYGILYWSTTAAPASRQAMSDARLSLAYRDSCAHLLIPLNRCRQEEYYLPWKCEVWSALIYIPYPPLDVFPFIHMHLLREISTCRPRDIHTKSANMKSSRSAWPRWTNFELRRGVSEVINKTRDRWLW